METPTFSVPNLRNISKNLNFHHNSTTNGGDFKELTLIQALRTPALVGALFLFSLIIFSIVGNALVCRTIFVTRRLHNPGYYFVASLAVADFLVGIFPLPLLLLFHITLEMKGKIGRNLWSIVSTALHLLTKPENAKKIFKIFSKI